MKRYWILLVFFGLAGAACTAGSGSSTTAAPATTTTQAVVGTPTTSEPPTPEALCQSAFILATADPPQVDEAAALLSTPGFDPTECDPNLSKHKKDDLVVALYRGGQCQMARTIGHSTFTFVCGSEDTEPADSPASACQRALLLATDKDSKDVNRAAEIVLVEGFKPEGCTEEDTGALAQALFVGDQCEAARQLARVAEELDEAAYGSSVCPQTALDRARSALLPIAVAVLVAPAVAAVADRAGQSRFIAGRMIGSRITRAVWRRWVGWLALVVSLIAVALLVAIFWPDVPPWVLTRLAQALAILLIAAGILLLFAAMSDGHGPAWAAFVFPVAVGAVVFLAASGVVDPTTNGLWIYASLAAFVAIVGMAIFRHGLEPPITVEADAKDDGPAIVSRVRAIAAGHAGGLGLVQDREEDVKLDAAAVDLAYPGTGGVAAKALAGLRRRTEYVITGAVDGLEPAHYVMRAAVYRGRHLVAQDTLSAVRFGVTPERLTGEDDDQEAFVKRLLTAVAAVWAVRAIEAHFFGSSRIYGTTNWRSAAYTLAGAEWHAYVDGDAGETIAKALYTQALAEDEANRVAYFNLGYIASADTDKGYDEATTSLKAADLLMVDGAAALGADQLIQIETKLNAKPRMVLRTRYNIIATALNEWARRRALLVDQVAAATRLADAMEALGATTDLLTNVQDDLATQATAAVAVATGLGELDMATQSRVETVATLTTQSDIAGSIKDALIALSADPDLEKDPVNVATALSALADDADTIRDTLTALSTDINTAGTLPQALRNSIERVRAVSENLTDSNDPDPLHPAFEAFCRVLVETPGIGDAASDCTLRNGWWSRTWRSWREWWRNLGQRGAASVVYKRARLIYMDACRLAAYDNAEKRVEALDKLEEAIAAEVVTKNWVRRDPCFYELRSVPAHARKFDGLTLPADIGLEAMYCVSSELAKAITSFGITDRKTLRSSAAFELRALADRYNVSRDLVKAAAEVARIEGERWPASSTPFTIHDANLLHTGGYRTAAGFKTGTDSPAGKARARANLRKSNGSKYQWDGSYGSWSAIAALVDREPVSLPEPTLVEVGELEASGFET